MPAVPQSHIAGAWLGHESGSALPGVVSGRPVAATHAEAVDFAAALHHARHVGDRASLAPDLQQRADGLKTLASVDILTRVAKRS